MSSNLILTVTKLKSAIKTKQKVLSITFSYQNLVFSKLLLENKLIFSYQIVSAKKSKLIVLTLKYNSAIESSITNLDLCSKVSRTITTKKIKKQNNNFSISVFSNSCGINTKSFGSFLLKLK